MAHRVIALECVKILARGRRRPVLFAILLVGVSLLGVCFLVVERGTRVELADAKARRGATDLSRDENQKPRVLVLDPQVVVPGIPNEQLRRLRGNHLRLLTDGRYVTVAAADEAPTTQGLGDDASAESRRRPLSVELNVRVPATIETIPAWIIGSPADRLIPNYAPGMAVAVLVSPAACAKVGGELDTPAVESLIQDDSLAQLGLTPR
jgi:hypothetical protein